MKNSLNNEKQISRVVKSRPYISKFFTLKKAPGQLDHWRFTVIVSKKIHKLATKRNLIKRKYRSIIREQMKNSSKIVDFVVFVKKSSLEANQEEIKKEIVRVLKLAKII